MEMPQNNLLKPHQNNVCDVPVSDVNTGSSASRQIKPSCNRHTHQCSVVNVDSFEGPSMLNEIPPINTQQMQNMYGNHRNVRSFWIHWDISNIPRTSRVFQLRSSFTFRRWLKHLQYTKLYTTRHIESLIAFPSAHILPELWQTKTRI